MLKNKILLLTGNPKMLAAVQEILAGYDVTAAVSLEELKKLFGQHEKRIAAVAVELNGSYAWSLLEYTQMQREVKNIEFFLMAIVEPSGSISNADSPFISEPDEAANEVELATQYNVDTVVTQPGNSADYTGISVLLEANLPPISAPDKPENQSAAPISENTSQRIAPTAEIRSQAAERLKSTAQELTDELTRLFREVNALVADSETPITWAEIDNVRSAVKTMRGISIARQEAAKL